MQKNILRIKTVRTDKSAIHHTNSAKDKQTQNLSNRCLFGISNLIRSKIYNVYIAKWTKNT